MRSEVRALWLPAVLLVLLALAQGFAGIDSFFLFLTVLVLAELRRRREVRLFQEVSARADKA